MTRATLTTTDKRISIRDGPRPPSHPPPNFICGAHMCPINTPIREKSWREPSRRPCLPAPLCTIHVKLPMPTPGQCGRLMERGMIMRRDLTDEMVLFCPLCCCNGQLSLIITINHTVCVLMQLHQSLVDDTRSQAYTKLIDALCFSPNSL